MSLSLLIFFGAVGWCGTVVIRWPIPPKPTPDPWWFIDRIVGIVGGVIGGWLFTQAWPVLEQGDVGLSVVAAGVGALIGAFILLDLYQGFVRRGAAAQS